MEGEAQAFRRRGTPLNKIADAAAAPQAEPAKEWESDRALQTLAPSQQSVVAAMADDDRNDREEPGRERNGSADSVPSQIAGDRQAV
ncbi:hypothetical protein MESS2_p100006 [Mesorhizobium metallidurans STM 2683]|uniref:Uncharacterized protein n=1 Tax=Mesorhizobium metallidurans STM 2683 TaxID=1297569 RepID=M5EWK2_9HYPH|nr:hypothetical protein MESS2_p100006 [Mesorhizobium metallidurans STM 2683]